MTSQTLVVDVFRAADFAATHGVRYGEPMSFADDMIMDDQYRLAPKSISYGLKLLNTETRLSRADGNGNVVHVDCCLTLMAPDGVTLELLILVEVANDLVADIHLLPLGEISQNTNYRLIGIERHAATRRFAQADGGSFARGTHITMGTGEMRPIEDLKAGDMVLTRDHGRQPIKIIGQSTLRATGQFAPVLIKKGALHNENDLVVRPDHRLFIYQREDILGAGRAEVLIKARHLVDDRTVVRRNGGFIEYFQLIFEEHYIIFAEGIAAESHFIDQRSRGALSDTKGVTIHNRVKHLDYEVQDGLTAQAGIVSVLRRASTS